MNLDRLTRFFDQLMTSFLDEDTEAFQRHFAFPVVIYSVAGLTLVRDLNELLRITGRFRIALKEASMLATNYEIAEFDSPNNNRLRVMVRFLDLDAEGSPFFGSLVRYFLVDGPDGYKIEMMEYLEVQLGLSEIERIVH